MSKIGPQDLSKISGAPSVIEGVQGREFQISPINPIKVAGERGRLVKTERQNSFMRLVDRRPSMNPKVISATLAEIEAQPYTMDTMLDELMTYDGMRFIIWSSVKIKHPEIRLDQVDKLIDDMSEALKRIMEISGMSVPAEDADEANPTSTDGPIPPTTDT